MVTSKTDQSHHIVGFAENEYQEQDELRALRYSLNPAEIHDVRYRVSFRKLSVKNATI